MLTRCSALIVLALAGAAPALAQSPSTDSWCERVVDNGAVMALA